MHHVYTVLSSRGGLPANTQPRISPLFNWCHKLHPIFCPLPQFRVTFVKFIIVVK